MRFGRTLACLLVAAAVLSAILVAATAPLFDRWQDDLGPVFRRAAEAIAVLGGVVLWRRSREGRAPKTPWKRAAGWLLGGFGAGAASFSLLIASEVARGTLRFEPEPASAWPGTIAIGLLTGLTVGLVEEVIFRGFVLGGLRQDHNLATALAASSLLFAALHYFRAAVPATTAGGLGVAWTLLAAHLSAVVNPAHCMQLVGLALAGAILAMARVSSGTLACAVGWHAGWVFVLKSARIAVEPNPGVRWLYEPGGIVGRPSVLVALVLLLVFVAVPSLRAGFWTRAVVERN